MTLAQSSIKPRIAFLLRSVVFTSLLFGIGFLIIIVSWSTSGILKSIFAQLNAKEFASQIVSKSFRQVFIDGIWYPGT